jgi:hypothetical protein
LAPGSFSSPLNLILTPSSSGISPCLVGSVVMLISGLLARGRNATREQASKTMAIVVATLYVFAFSISFGSVPQPSMSKVIIYVVKPTFEI